MYYEIQNQYGVLTVTEPDSPREIRFITPEYRRHSGNTLIADGSLSDCLQYRYDSAEWYVTKDGEFCSSQWHHDGCNRYTFRKFRDGATEDERGDLLEKLYDGTAKQTEIDRVTEKLGYRVGEVYGWHFPDEKIKERGRER